MISDKELLEQLEAYERELNRETKRLQVMALVFAGCASAAGIILMAAIVWSKVG
jgi:hypothetical protein